MAEQTTTMRRGGGARAAVRWLALPAVAGLALLVWGGYARHWQWTGFDHNDTLWDWLSLLLLPVALAALPVWLTRRRTLDPRRRAILAGALVAFAALVLAGYLVPLAWTGFSDNHLWDWLQLLVLPAVLGTSGFWAQRSRRLGPVARLAVVTLALGFAVTVVGGYEFGWEWTGFSDNTLWDWLELLLVPIIVPTLLVPAALAWLSRDEPGEDRRPRDFRA